MIPGSGTLGRCPSASCLGFLICKPWKEGGLAPYGCSEFSVRCHGQGFVLCPPPCKRIPRRLAASYCCHCFIIKRCSSVMLGKGLSSFARRPAIIINKITSAFKSVQFGKTTGKEEDWLVDAWVREVKLGKSEDSWWPLCLYLICDSVLLFCKNVSIGENWVGDTQDLSVWYLTAPCESTRMSSYKVTLSKEEEGEGEGEENVWV